MILKILLALGLCLTIVYLFMIVTDADRPMMLAFKSLPSLTDRYVGMPKPSRRTVIVLSCPEGLCETTLKSLLDQSVRVSDIAVETNRPDLLSQFANVVSIHDPGTTRFRENEAESIVFFLENGKIYDYDFLETELNKLEKSLR